MSRGLKLQHTQTCLVVVMRTPIHLHLFNRHFKSLEQNIFCFRVSTFAILLQFSSSTILGRSYLWHIQSTEHWLLFFCETATLFFPFYLHTLSLILCLGSISLFHFIPSLIPAFNSWCLFTAWINTTTSSSSSTYSSSLLLPLSKPWFLFSLHHPALLSVKPLMCGF